MGGENLSQIDEERAFSHWLCNIEGIGRRGQRRLLEEAGSARAVYEMEESRLARLLSPAQTGKLLRAQKERDVWEDYGRLERKGILYCPSCDPAFPQRLALIPDPPVGIYVTGRLPEDDIPAVAVIGARACSEYGKYAARRFAGILAASGVNIISGMARGIDGIGQEAALDNRGYTGAVMGCGVDVCYPEENRALYERIKVQGGILSEYPPGVGPRAGLFPERNRIISGLADLVLVIEAREKSGTLITVDMALEQGKEVMVVPGRITDRLSGGCNRLLRQGAGLALTPEDVLETLDDSLHRGLTSSYREKGGRVKEAAVPSLRHAASADVSLKGEGSSFKRSALEALDYTPIMAGQVACRMEEAGWKAGLPEVMHALLELVLEGKCAQDGSYFYRI